MSKRKKDHDWTHPVHGRGVKSHDFSRGIIGALLTDARIHHYALAGRYGSDIQCAAEEIERRKSEAARKRATTQSVKQAMNKLLGL